MKRSLIVSVLIMAIPCLAASQQGKKSNRNKNAPAALPNIRLLYPPPIGSIFDRTCTRLTKTEIKSEWVEETVRRAPEFQALWDKEGPAYLSATFAEVGMEFPYREMQATLTVCPPVSNMSIPLLINVLPFLSTVQATVQHTVPMGHLSETIFHELMHHYVTPVYSTSELRRKYQKEHPQVLSHLHVMALEKFALLKLGKEEELKFLDQFYRNNPPPAHYKRAWEIVSDIEGHEAFVKELKLVRK